MAESWATEARLRSMSRLSVDDADNEACVPLAQQLGFIEEDFEPFDEEPGPLPETKPGEVPIRRLSWPVFRWLERNGALPSGWEKYPHTALDFSGDLFRLRSIQPLDFRWRRKERVEVVSPRLQRVKSQEEFELTVGQLHTLKLDNNELFDVDFDPAKDVGLNSSAFANLRTLTLSRNRLTFPILLLPRLKELDLSYNRLVQVIPLTGLAALETLILSHNQIEELDPKPWRDGVQAQLKALDLRNNRLQVTPKSLEAVFEEWARGTALSHLRMSGNPFCSLFPEYHMLAILCIPRLRHLDRVAVGAPTSQMRKEMTKAAKKYFGLSFTNYVTHDGKLLETVNSVSSFPDTSSTDSLDEVNRVLQRELGLEVTKRWDARVFFLRDRVEDLDGLRAERQEVSGNGGLRKTVKNRLGAGVDTAEAPLLSSMIQELDSAIAGHTLIINSSTIVFQKASQLASLPPERQDSMFDDVRVKPNIKTGRMDPHVLRAAREDVSKTFAEQVCMLAERHRDLRNIFVRTLAKCGSIATEVAPPCLAGLAVLAQANDETRKAVLSVVEEIILPAMREGQIMQDSTAELYQAVAKLNCEGLEEVLANYVVDLASSTKTMLRTVELASSKMPAKVLQRCESTTKLLEVAVGSPEAVQGVIKEDVLRVISEYISQDVIFLDKTECWVYVACVNIMLGCIRHRQQEAFAAISALSFPLHKKLLENLEELSTSKETPSPTLNRKAGSCLELLSFLAKDEQVLEDLASLRPGQTIPENGFVKTILAVPCATLADPVRLTGSLRCLGTILYSDRQRRRYGTTIVKALELMDKKLNKIWGYIDGAYFREVSRICEMYSKHEDSAKDAQRGFSAAEIVNLQGVTDPNKQRNPFMHNMLVSVINFLKIFSELATGDSKELCTQVSQVFNELGRESVLFKLLQVPSPEVQEAVMSCLEFARLEELDDEEVQQLLHMLDPDMVESGEQLLGAVLGCLGGFLVKDGEAADKFRTNHTRSVIHRTFAVLAENSARDTFGNPSEEEQKLTLSEQCVQVLRTASYQPLLRRHLRGEVAKNFGRMLKDEESKDTWTCRDVSMELTWTGRHLDLLLSCLNTASNICLRNDMKQAFRVFHRIANVMAGVGDHADQARSAEARAAEETVMWNEQLMRQQANTLDDHAYEDQLQQQLIFFSFSGIERMVHFLEMPPEDGTAQPAEPAEGAVTKSDRSVAVELQQQAKKYLEGLLSFVESADAAEAAKVKSSEKREDPEMVAIEDTEIPKLGSRGEELLRQVYAMEGWKSLGSSSSQEDMDVFTKTVRNAHVTPSGSHVSSAASNESGIASLLDDLFRRSQGSHHESLWVVEVCPSALPIVPKRLCRTDHFFLPGTNGLVNRSFFVASLLRTIYSALMLPTTESVSGLVNFRLRNPAMQLRLVALLEKCGSYVDCHLAAKLMRIFALVLRPRPDQSSISPKENDWQHAISLVIAAGLAGRVLELLAPLTRRLGKGYELTAAHLILAREAVRLLKAVAAAVSQLQFSTNLAVQKDAMEAMTLVLVPMPTVKDIVTLLLYDMQVNAGGKALTKDLALKTIGLQDVHSLCSETMAWLLHLAPSIRYEIVELMTQYKILGQQQLHTSFVSDLMDRSETLRLTRALELLLAETGPYAGEKVLQLAWAEMPDEGTGHFFAVALGFVRKGGGGPRLLAVTNRRLIILGQSRHGAGKRPCGLCPPESFCPIGPEIFRSYGHNELTRIYSASDAQLLVVGRLQKSKLGEVQDELFDIFVFHQADAQREFKERLTTLSGTSAPSRVKIQQETLVDKAAKSKTASRIARTTWAFRETDSGERLSLFVLTELNFFELEANFNLWIPSSVMDEKGHVSENEYDGGESDEDVGESAKVRTSFSLEIANAARRARASKFSLERRSLEEPLLAERASERLARRYKAPPTEWLLDGIVTGAQAGADTLWQHFSEQDIAQASKDREKAQKLTEEKLFELPGASRDMEQANKSKIMREKRKAILTQQLKCPVLNLREVSFEQGSTPILRLIFKTEKSQQEEVAIRFLDDAARETWRRNLQFVLQKSASHGSQWGRGYEKASGAAPATRSGRSAQFFAHH